MKLIKSLSGGRRNKTELYQNGSDLLVKKTFPTIKNFDFYACERDTLEYLNASYPFAPKLVDFNDDERSLTCEFIEGFSAEKNKNINYDVLGKILGKLHSIEYKGIKKEFSFHRNPLTDLEDILKFFVKQSIDVSSNEEKALRDSFSYSNEMSPIHGSLIPSNIVSKNNNLYLIDFEMASYNSPFLDLAYLSGHITPEQRNLLKQGYLAEQNMTSEEYDSRLLYGRNHLPALTLLLYQQDNVDSELRERSQKLKEFLTTPLLGTSEEEKIINLFKKIQLK